MTNEKREPTDKLPATNHFDVVVSRRQLLQASVAGAVAAMFGLPGCAGVSRSPVPAIGFKAVPLSAVDTLVVPDGYRAATLFAWGDPVGHVSGSPPFRFDAGNSAGAAGGHAS